MQTFLKTRAETMKTKKAANMTNAIKEYIPEHGRSIVNDAGCPAEVVSMIVGDPYVGDNETGKPKVLSKA